MPWRTRGSLTQCCPWILKQPGNKCHENFTDTRVSCESRGGRGVFLLEKSWESLGQRVPWSRPWSTRRALCSLPWESPLFAIVLCLPQQPYRMGGLGRAVEQRSLYTCHAWLLVGFSWGLFCSCLFQVYFSTAFRTQWHTFLWHFRTQCQTHVDRKRPWAETANLS